MGLLACSFDESAKEWSRGTLNASLSVTDTSTSGLDRLRLNTLQLPGPSLPNTIVVCVRHPAYFPQHRCDEKVVVIAPCARTNSTHTRPSYTRLLRIYKPAAVVSTVAPLDTHPLPVYGIFEDVIFVRTAGVNTLGTSTADSWVGEQVMQGLPAVPGATRNTRPA